jgi:hypothetical protein
LKSFTNNIVSICHTILCCSPRLLLQSVLNPQEGLLKGRYAWRKSAAKLDVIHVIGDFSYGDSATTFELIEGLKGRGKKLLGQCKSHAAGNNIQAETLLKLGDHAQCPVVVVR